MGVGLGSGLTIRQSRGSTFLKVGTEMGFRNQDVEIRILNQDLVIRIKESCHINQGRGANETFETRMIMQNGDLVIKS